MSKTAEVKFEDLPAETRAAMEPVLKAIETFKSDHTEALKTKANANDVVTKEKHDKMVADIDGLKTALNEAVAKMNRAGGNGEDEQKTLKTKAAKLSDADKRAFEAYIRAPNNAVADRLINQHFVDLAHGDEWKGLADAWGIEQKDLSTVVAAEGGYMVLPEYEAEMEEILLETSPVRQLADVREIGTSELKLPINRKGTAVAWINEKGTRNETATPTISQESFYAQELYAYPEVTLVMLEDALFDVESWLADEVTEAFAIEEATQFVSGDGNGKPLGFLHSSIGKVAASGYDANTNWGSWAYIATGTSGAFAPSYPGEAVGPTAATQGADALIDVVYDLKARYRANADWAMSRRTLGAVRKLKDGQGNYVIRDAITADGMVPMLLGYPTWEFEDMPEIGADSYSIAFGDFRKAYQIVDRIGMQVRRDEITKPGFVKFHFRKRTGGGPKHYDALKLLKFGTS